jgi:hypothetical protein
MLLAAIDTAIELARIVPRTIIDISKQSLSKQYRETKQAKLYDLINGG